MTHSPAPIACTPTNFFKGLALAARRVEHPQLAMLQVLVDIALSSPDIAQLLLGESLAAGEVGLALRDGLISGIQQTIELSAQQQTTDLPPALLIGGAFRFLSMHLAQGAAHDPRQEILHWVAAFQRPPGPSATLWSASFFPQQRSCPPRALGPSHDAPLSGSTRERILQATATCVAQRGYRATSIAEIVERAGVSRRSFYNEFANKATAFVAAYELGFERTLAACVPAFFSVEQWPERVWRSALAFTGYFARHPSFAYLGFVECHALGRQFDARVHATQLAFTLFLDQGYRQDSGSQGPRACSALSAATIAEAGYLASRRSPGVYMRSMQPLAVYIALAPFIGGDQARDFLTHKLAGAPSLSSPTVP